MTLSVKLIPMKPKILTVEDNSDLSDLLALYLRTLGYKSLQARNATTAIRKALSERPALIIMDLCLPDLTGVEAAALLKKDPATSRIPIVLLTAFPCAVWKKQALEAGVSACLQKPIAPSELAEVVAGLLDKAGDSRREESGEIDSLENSSL